MYIPLPEKPRTKNDVKYRGRNEAMQEIKEDETKKAYSASASAAVCACVREGRRERKDGNVRII